ncbi:hypothetical protein [Streptomyces sp. NPDC006446]|uniref:hypothetical protein n=1 Tax=Streptomyces sp. NPDC006446 TaxID=3154301 RepID=UPI0033ADA56A
MRRLLLLAPLLLLTAGCGVVQSSNDEATDAAREVARKAGERLYGQRPRTAEEVGRSASTIDGVEVLRSDGYLDTRRGRHRCGRPHVRLGVQERARPSGGRRTALFRGAGVAQVAVA